MLIYAGLTGSEVRGIVEVLFPRNKTYDDCCNRLFFSDWPHQEHGRIPS